MFFSALILASMSDLTLALTGLPTCALVLRAGVLVTTRLLGFFCSSPWMTYLPSSVMCNGNCPAKFTWYILGKLEGTIEVICVLIPAWVNTWRKRWSIATLTALVVCALWLLLFTWKLVASAELGWAQAVVASNITLIRLAGFNTDNITEGFLSGFW